jgi:membrane protein DedA with SNARE-associated domain
VIFGALPGFFQALEPTIQHHGYVAVGGLIFLEDFGVPVPGETALITAAVYAGTGHLSLLVVALVAMLAAVLGDNLGYLIGRVGGLALVTRFGKYVGLTARRYDTAEKFFQRQGPKIVIIARFVEGLRQANGIIAGTTEMPWRSFLIFNSIGAALWVTTWVLIGDLAGQHLDAIYREFQRYSLVAVILAVVVIVALVFRHLHARKVHASDNAQPIDEVGASE